MSLPIYCKGSEWRKWDLHIHTPHSIIQHYKNTPENWNKFISAIEHLPEDIKVIGITDYYFIDGYKKVMEYRQSGRMKNIEKIFPILEFRIDTFGSGNENKLQKINLHILFNLDENNLDKEIKKVKDEFIDKINLSSLGKHKTKKLSPENFALEGGDLQTGFESLIPSTQQVLEFINSDTWKDKTFLLLGYKEWSNLEKNNQLKPLKEWLYDCVRAFLGNNFPNNEANQKWLNEFGDKRLLHSLDIHGFDQLDTFEFDEKQNHIPSTEYHCNTWIKADPTFEGLKQVIYEPQDRVAIQANLPEDKPGYQVIEKIEIINEYIFNDSLQLNPNLNSIIGGRSTGKSILLAAIAKKLKTERPVVMIDPDYDRFIQEVSDSIKVFWKDGKQEDNREIEYFQQGYMYELARSEEKLSKLIQDILKQKGKELVLNAYHKSVAENKKKISDLISDFFQILKDINEKEQKAREKGDKKGIEDEISKLTEELKKLNTITITEEEKESFEEKKESIVKANQNKQTFQTDIQNINSLKEVSLFKESIAYELTSVSENQKRSVEAIFKNLKDEFEKKWQTELVKIIKDVQGLETKEDELIQQTSKDDIYVKVSKAFSENIQLNEYSEKIQLQKDKLFEINTLIDEIEKLKTQRDNLKENIKKAHQSYFLKINELIPKLSDSKDGLEIKARVKFNQSLFTDILNSGLNLQGSLNQSLVDFKYKNDNEAYEKHLFDLFDKLYANNLTLKGGYNNQSLTNRILSECFYYLSYDIEYEHDDYKKMSDGKKAFVVLKLLLDFSDKDCPILIDQPEDDLDNRAIYSDLVQYLRKKKRVRQIIVATHNSNIVVGADSELIICANQHGIKNFNRDGKKFQYTAGSLEHTVEKINKVQEVLEAQGIREHVCEILEGGDVAFKLREKKYGIKA